VDVLGLSSAWDSVVWPVLYVPLLLAVVVILDGLTRDGPAPIRRQTRVGLALLGGAVALEVASAPWDAESLAVATVEGGFEEAAEQAGWTLLASAVVATALRDVIAQARRGQRPRSSDSPSGVPMST
jgi:hypothetical protein